jgi:hypothetical protein
MRTKFKRLQQIVVNEKVENKENAKSIDFAVAMRAS